METRRIAMWSGPRNISTAMMRSFENRADCRVVDEPFYSAYLVSTGLDHPGREEIIESQSSDPAEVARELLAPREGTERVFYQKHMTQHVLPTMDLAFTAKLINCFLIREPRKIIASYARVRPDFSLDELGFSQQKRLFDAECDRLGETPPVVDAAMTLANPEGVLTALCSRIGIPFDDAMLSWPSGARDTDGVWARYWYASVEASTKFAAPVPPESATSEEARTRRDSITLTPAQERLCEEASAVYAQMLSCALT